MAIYDCFTFFDELDVLEFRLNFLNNYIDYFVIVELGVTYRGKKIDPVFLNNKKRFEKFLHKIIYVSSDYIPKNYGDGDWSIEYWQRNCIMKGLVSCKPNDIIMISDVDEIPNPNIFRNFEDIWVYPNLKNNSLRKILFCFDNYNRNTALKLLKKQKLNEAIKVAPVACRQRLFYYYLNCEAKKNNWNGTVICEYQNMRMPQGMRNLKSRIPIINNAGWHFSNLGGLEKIKSKLANSMNDDRKEILDRAKKIRDDDQFILSCIEKGIDIFGRSGEEFDFSFIPIEDIRINRIPELFPHFENYIHMV